MQKWALHQLDRQTFAPLPLQVFSVVSTEGQTVLGGDRMTVESMLLVCQTGG